MGPARAPDVAAAVRELADASVQFVLVGDAGAGEPARFVVSRHPTNLDALGRALDKLGARVRGAVDLGVDDPRVGEPRRVGDALGTVALTTSAGDVDILLGGPRHSLYADAASRAEEREIDGRRVPWTAELPEVGPPVRVTSRMLGRRLLRLVEGLAHLIDHDDGTGDDDHHAAPDPGA